jgi:hypothetical protein
MTSLLTVTDALFAAAVMGCALGLGGAMYLLARQQRPAQRQLMPPPVAPAPARAPEMHPHATHA